MMNDERRAQLDSVTGEQRRDDGDRLVGQLEAALQPLIRELVELRGPVAGWSIVSSSLGRLFVRNMIEFYRTANDGEVPTREHMHAVMIAASLPLCDEVSSEYRRHMREHTAIRSVVKPEAPHG